MTLLTYVRTFWWASAVIARTSASASTVLEFSSVETPEATVHPVLAVYSIERSMTARRMPQ